MTKKISIYLQKSKILSCMEGTVVEKRTEDTWTIMVYTEKKLRVITSATLKNSNKLPHNMNFILLGINIPIRGFLAGSSPIVQVYV